MEKKPNQKIKEGKMYICRYPRHPRCGTSQLIERMGRLEKLDPEDREVLREKLKATSSPPDTPTATNTDKDKYDEIFVFNNLDESTDEVEKFDNK